ncbi:hypothetical protein [Microbacterium galbinum]|uniref:Uncharacterized protein n=1 Tax=Microbacterium galbinum TaxID=2851646 RepID=A0ABY4IRH7_9MICO|nr:hypothetical protein [Microbacterium galbinum]UPL13888.1 hypothetical protein KV396_05080 [Microbacterium galbinum]
MPSMPLPRLAAALVVTAALLPLSGCIYAQIPADAPAAEDTTTPAPEETSTADGIPTTLSFDDGLSLPSTAYIQWGDGLLVDEGWEMASPDDGQGNWSYATVDGSCTAHFWQGTIGADMQVAGDDSATSDAVIAAVLGGSPEDITPNATTGAFSYQVGGNDAVENRQVVGQDTGRTWIVAARAFSEVGVGLYVIVDCTTGDPATVLAEIADTNSVVVTP